MLIEHNEILNITQGFLMTSEWDQSLILPVCLAIWLLAVSIILSFGLSCCLSVNQSTWNSKNPVNKMQPFNLPRWDEYWWKTLLSFLGWGLLSQKKASSSLYMNNDLCNSNNSVIMCLGKSIIDRIIIIFSIVIIVIIIISSSVAATAAASSWASWVV